MKTIACFGGANIDIIQRCCRHPVLHTSNPTVTTYHFGGVARNIAERLARSNTPSALISMVGDDVYGNLIVNAMSDVGVDTEYVLRSNTYPTGSYTALIDPNGELFIATADMTVIDNFTPAIIGSAARHYADAPIWLVDNNLTEEVVHYLSEQRSDRTSLWGIAVSIPKLPAFASTLESFDGLSLNGSELLALTGKATLDEAANYCLERADLTLCVTNGSDDVRLYSRKKSRFFLVPTVDVDDVTGAGDTFTAAVLNALFQQEDIETAIGQAVEETAAWLVCSNRRSPILC
ncbi:MAG: hypothetical protein H7A37_00425 [Chlamydiales bacterium]|nr:hypothetical protein [Chlamydiia bacterium]MCP5506758.1 hypothetical protein [Chlamydiales bacterium]